MGEKHEVRRAETRQKLQPPIKDFIHSVGAMTIDVKLRAVDGLNGQKTLMHSQTMCLKVVLFPAEVSQMEAPSADNTSTQ